MSKPFHFKRFTVHQDVCAMKVGTDGVLLGAWARTPNSTGSILDIGTGSGVIALMLAQRFPQSNVLGIDIDKGAVSQANENFRKSSFANRLSVQHIALQEFDSTQQFDTIVSNPPFFTNGVLPMNEQRKLARHTTSFSFQMLFSSVVKLLSSKGVFSIIAPKSEQENLINLAMENGLCVKEICCVYPNPAKKSKRILLAFSREARKTELQTEIIIETEQRHHYTKEYKTLLKDFYLGF